MAKRVRRSENDDGAARSSHSPLRHRRDRQRKLALQKPRLIFKPLLNATAPTKPRRNAVWRALRRCLARNSITSSAIVGHCPVPVRAPRPARYAGLDRKPRYPSRPSHISAKLDPHPLLIVSVFDIHELIETQVGQRNTDRQLLLLRLTHRRAPGQRQISPRI